MRPDQAEATRKLLATMWERNLPVVRERVDQMERAARAAETGDLSAEDRASAGDTAHKLAGSLGMFGYQHGTEIARSLEQMLDGREDLDIPKLGELARELRQEVHL